MCCSASQLYILRNEWLMCEMHLSLLSQLGAAYISATTGAVVTALGLKSLATVMDMVHAQTLIQI